jgi:hypothetical protein
LIAPFNGYNISHYQTVRGAGFSCRAEKLGKKQGYRLDDSSMDGNMEMAKLTLGKRKRLSTLYLLERLSLGMVRKNQTLTS